MTDQPTTSSATLRAGNITKCLIKSVREEGKESDISQGIVDFNYFESILDNTYRFRIGVVDSGQQGLTALRELKMSGFEKAEIIFEDNLSCLMILLMLGTMSLVRIFHLRGDKIPP